MKGVIQRLRMCRAPTVLAILLGFLAMKLPSESLDMEKYRFVEFFAGDAQSSAAWLDQGDSVASVDVKFDAKYNILAPHGFLVHMVKAVQCDLCSLMAPVCSSWGPINRGTSGRSLGNPAGRTSLKYVKESNTMAARCVLLMWLWAGVGTCFIVEQPANSLLYASDRWQEFMRHNRLFKKRINMKEGWALKQSPLIRIAAAVAIGLSTGPHQKHVSYYCAI